MHKKGKNEDKCKGGTNKEITSKKEIEEHKIRTEGIKKERKE
jgi:hypothetical protein